MKRYIILTLYLFCACTLRPAHTPDYLYTRKNTHKKWRGFNLLEKFSKEYSNSHFREKDFQLIHELGFNFVRLPMDYRVWIKNGDWNQFDESVFADLDQVIEWGHTYAIHICINFHRAPGFTVNVPAEPTSLWTDSNTQTVAARHWAYFAKRYKHISNEHLSFNLLNEPKGVDEATHHFVIQKLVDAIRAEDPTRLIIVDGRRWGSLPNHSLKTLGVAQSTRGYAPSSVTHYKASWVKNAEHKFLPVWPIPRTTQYLYGPSKSDKQNPMYITLDVPHDTRLRFRLGKVSQNSHLIVRLNNTVIWQKHLPQSAYDPHLKEVSQDLKWGTKHYVYNQDYTLSIPTGHHTLRFENTEGDWLTLTELGFHSNSYHQEYTIKLASTWNHAQSPMYITCSTQSCTLKTERLFDQQWLWDTTIVPWLELEREGIGIMVLEWGAHHHTPHDVTLRWMADVLKNYHNADWGWALWNFRGAFGILDSGRSDVTYVKFKGHQLDQKMLELLQQY